MNYISFNGWLITVEPKTGKLWIVAPSGEGGEFDSAKFAEVIREFFDKEF